MIQREGRERERKENNLWPRTAQLWRDYRVHRKLHKLTHTQAFKEARTGKSPHLKDFHDLPFFSEDIFFFTKIQIQKHTHMLSNYSSHYQWPMKTLEY